MVSELLRIATKNASRKPRKPSVGEQLQVLGYQDQALVKRDNKTPIYNVVIDSKHDEIHFYTLAQPTHPKFSIDNRSLWLHNRVYSVRKKDNEFLFNVDTRVLFWTKSQSEMTLYCDHETLAVYVPVMQVPGAYHATLWINETAFDNDLIIGTLFIAKHWIDEVI